MDKQKKIHCESCGDQLFDGQDIYTCSECKSILCVFDGEYSKEACSDDDYECLECGSGVLILGHIEGS